MANRSHLPQAWRESGLSQRAFCEREGVSLATFSYWRQKELLGGEGAPAPAPAFTELVVDNANGPSLAPAVAIEVTYPDGTRVTIPVPSAAARPPC